jgi:hypothetical protein
MMMSYSHGYSKEDHGRMIKFFEWVKTHVPTLTKETLLTLEKDLPTQIFQLRLNLSKSGKKGKDNSGECSDSSGHSDDEQRALKDSLRNQFTRSTPSTNLFGKFELPKGHDEDEYPSGYFDPFIDIKEQPYWMTFKQYFDNTDREGFEPFAGDPSSIGVAYPVFFEKFRVTVHLRREDKVSVEMKFKIFCSLMKENSRAQKKLKLYSNWADYKSAYDNLMRDFWDKFGADRETLLENAKVALGKIKPASDSQDDTMDFVYECNQHYQTLIQNGMNGPSAAKKVCRHIITEIDSTIRIQYLNNKNIKYGDMHKFYKSSPQKYLHQFPKEFERIFKCRNCKRKRQDSEDDDLSFNAKLTRTLINSNSAPTPSYSSYSKSGASSSNSNTNTHSTRGRSFGRGRGRGASYSGGREENGSRYHQGPPQCFFCPGEHRPRDCPLTITQRLKLVADRTKCFNCLSKDCKGTEFCKQDSKCRTCASTNPSGPKHSSWLCRKAAEKYAESGQDGSQDSKATIKQEGGSSGNWPPKAAPTRSSYSATEAAAVASSLAELQNTQNPLLTAALTDRSETSAPPSGNS